MTEAVTRSLDCLGLFRWAQFELSSGTLSGSGVIIYSCLTLHPSLTHAGFVLCPSLARPGRLFDTVPAPPRARVSRVLGKRTTRYRSSLKALGSCPALTNLGLGPTCIHTQVMLITVCACFATDTCHDFRRHNVTPRGDECHA